MTESTASASTALLRTSSEPLYVRLRDVLEDRGVDVRTCVLATLFANDGDMEYGIVVTEDRRVHEFDLHYGSGDLSTAVRMARLTSWRDITDAWSSNPSRDDVEAALTLLDEPELPVSWASTAAEVDRRRGSARRAVGQRLVAVRYIDIDYGQLDRTELPEGPREITQPVEWASPPWRFPAFHSVDFGVELEFEFGTRFSITWDAPGEHEGLGVHERPMLGTFVSLQATTAVWDVGGEVPWLSLVGLPVDDVDLDYEPWADDGSFWCPRVTVTLAGTRVDFVLGEGRVGSTEIHPSADNVAVTWSASAAAHIAPSLA